MKFNIHVYQQGIVEAGLHHQTDLIDWAIVDYIKDFSFSPDTKKVVVAEEEYTWINYFALIKA
ncbi:MAG: hypothetical protein ACK4WF_03410, partial [Candidatus Brocadiales bacterium]